MKWDLTRLIEQIGKVCEITPDGCWLWRHGSWSVRDLTGVREYPRLCIAGRRLHVARWVLEATEGRRDDAEPCHSCDMPPCVSPAHLRWGTHAENMREMGARRRSGMQRYPDRYRWEVRNRGNSGFQPGDAHLLRRNPGLVARGDRHGSKTHPERWARGERQGSARLSEDAVRVIRKRLVSGEKPAVIAPDFGVGRGTIRAIAEGRTWRHVT